MKKKVIILSLIVLIIVVSAIIIGYICCKNPSKEPSFNDTKVVADNNPLGLSDDFHYMTTTQDDGIHTIYYIYKESKIPILIEMDKDHFVHSLWVMNTSNNNYQETIDLACYLVNNVLSSFTDEQKSQIIYNVNNEEYCFDIDGCFFFISTNSGCEIKISPSRN